MSKQPYFPRPRPETSLALSFIAFLALTPDARANGPCPDGDCLQTCLEQDDCAAGESCIDYMCQTGGPCVDCKPDPIPCDPATPCPTDYHICVGGFCELKPLPECGKVKPCAGGLFCVDGQCGTTPGPGDCSALYPCRAGDTCVDGRCEPTTNECRSDRECRGNVCVDGQCVPRYYDPPALVPVSLPKPPKTRDSDDEPPVWNLPDGDDPFGNIGPIPPAECGADSKGKLLCCSHVTGWSFEKDAVDDNGKSLYQPWNASGVFGRGPVYGNNVHIDRIKPPGYTDAPGYGPSGTVGGDYWAFSRGVNQQGKWWIGSSDLRSEPTDLPGSRLPDTATGTLQSPRFIVDTSFIRFFIGGDSVASQRVQLEIYEPNAAKRALLAKGYQGIGITELPAAANYLPVPPSEPEYVVVRASSPKVDSEYMQRRVAWDVTAYKGLVARITVVDSDKWGWHPTGAAHINIDEVICTNDNDDGATFDLFLKNGRPSGVGGKKNPIPLWGITDTHSHPFANLAFGGDLVWGDPHDELADVYSCNGELPAIGDAIEVREAKQQVSADSCGASDKLAAMVATVPCELWLGLPVVGIPLAEACVEMRWDVTDVLMNIPLATAHSLHGSSSALSGGLTLPGVIEVLQEITPFMNIFGTIFPSADLPDFGTIAAGMPRHVHGFVEILGWDKDDGGHSKHGVKAHQIYQKDMIRRAYQGGLRLIGLDVIDSRTITTTLDADADYNEWTTIRDTTLSARHLVSCGEDPLFPKPGPLCDIAGIAYSPTDVRTLLGENRLAIILGTEVDELGVPRGPGTMAAFGHSPLEQDTIALQVADLYDLGIRKVTAIHALNNPLGGAGVFNDTYLTGSNELSNVLDPNHVDAESLMIPFFVAGEFTADMIRINHRVGNPNAPFFPEWYEDRGGWVAVDQKPYNPGYDWIGGGITFEYGFPSVATPLGFGATTANLSTPSNVYPTPAFNSKGTWAGVAEVQFPTGVDQLLKGGEMCALDGVGLPLDSNEAWVPSNVRYEYQAAISQGIGHANAVGLRPEGEDAIKELMKRGMIIDLDHFSQKARVDTWAVAEELGETVFEDSERLYPFLGVHTNSRTHERHGPFPDFEDLRHERGYSAETDRTEPEFLASRRDGGVFSPGANAGYMTDHDDQLPQVRNDCDFSSKSFAHRYLWMMDIMDGRGVTPSTDMSPFFTGAAPRFGQLQCHLRTSFRDDLFGLETAKDSDGNSLEFPHFCSPNDYQDLPVSQWLPPAQCKSHQWPHDWQPDPAVKDGQWCKIWGKDIPTCPTYQNLEAQYTEGAGVWYEDYAGRELPAAEQITQNGAPSPVTLVAARRADEERDDAAPRAEIDEIVAIGGARQIWPMKKMKTNAGWKLNPAKNTGWDVNLDGFPHIGLFPDFLQDVRNVGVSWERMGPMFNAVEDYVRMWERSCELAGKWAKSDMTVPGCK